MKPLIALIASALVVGILVQRPAAATTQDTTDAAVTLSPAELDTLVQTRCTVCHKKASPGGGLVFEGLDAAHLDPAVAALMIVKVTEDRAMTAAGKPNPDAATTAAFVRAMSAIARGATGRWRVTLTVDPREPNHGHALVTARTVQDGRELAVSCNGATRHGSAQVTAAGRALAASSAGSGSVPTAFDIDGKRVSFAADDLSPTVRQMLSTCFQEQARTN